MYDHARIFRRLINDLGQPQAGERARPLQTLVWYPAQSSIAQPFKVSDYARLMSTETHFDKAELSASSERRMQGFKPTLQATLWAVQGATPAAGRFPVVIYAPGASGWSWENADLCEYLASHGYVVIASNSMGSTTRNMTIDVAGVNAQAADVSYLIGYAGTLPNTDMSKVAAMGFSFGGLSVLAAAARDDRIDALVTLDGSMRYYPDLVKDLGDTHPDEMTIPLLAFTQGDIAIEDQIRYFPRATHGPNVLNEWKHGDLVTIHMLALAHVEFSAMNQRNEDVWKNSWFKTGYGREDGISSYAWIARYTLQFLDAYLKRDDASMAFLKQTPTEAGVPDHFIAIEKRDAHGLPPTIDTFRAAVGRRGFNHAAEIYDAMKEKDATFALDEHQVDSWADELISNHHMPEAMDILQLNARNHPQSGGVYESLGFANLRSGHKSAAADNFRKALAIDPDDADAQQQLKELGAP
jgi:dienelactone hydrolase